MHEIQEKLLKLIATKDISQLTLREICKLVDVSEKLPQKIKHHLNQLEIKGFIIITNGTITRATSKSPEKTLFNSIPIVGAANCGPANIYADQNIEGYLKISKRLISREKGIFAIKAQGNSLNKANIKGKSVEQGDFVIIDSNQISPKNGDYILAIIDGMANIKKYCLDAKNNRVILLSESTQNYFPIFLHSEDDFRINGKVIDIVKKFELP